MTDSVRLARAEHEARHNGLRDDEIHEETLCCLSCGHVWEGYVEEGEPENCVREDCKSDSVARS